MRVFRPADHGRPVRIAATGHHLPARVVTNADLVAAGAPFEEAEIERLSGIRTRHWVAGDEATSDLAVAAARTALERAGVGPAAVDRLIVGTVSPDHMSPSAACLAQHALGLRPVPALDLTASCSGFLYALDAAARAVATGEDHVLAVAADVRSRFLDLEDRSTCALFGDGAGAALVTAGDDPEAGLVAIGLLADGSGARSVYVPAGGSRRPASAETVAAREHCIRMESGPQVYLSAVEGMLGTAERLLDALGLTFADVDLVVPHQPNRRILDRMARLARIPVDRIYVNIDRTGNVSGASVAIALDEVLTAGLVAPGARVLLLAAGAGYTAGAALLVPDDALLAAARPLRGCSVGGVAVVGGEGGDPGVGGDDGAGFDVGEGADGGAVADGDAAADAGAGVDHRAGADGDAGGEGDVARDEGAGPDGDRGQDEVAVGDVVAGHEGAGADHGAGLDAEESRVDEVDVGGHVGGERDLGTEGAQVRPAEDVGRVEEGLEGREVEDAAEHRAEEPGVEDAALHQGVAAGFETREHGGQDADLGDQGHEAGAAADQSGDGEREMRREPGRELDPGGARAAIKRERQDGV